RNYEILYWRRLDDGLAGVGVERRRQIDQQKSHGWNASAKMLAGVPMADLMPAHGHQRQYVKNDKIAPALVGKIEELQTVTADLRPVRHSNGSHDHKQQKRENREPPCVDKARVAVQPGQEFVRVHCRERNLRQVTVSPFPGLNEFLPLLR